MASTAHDESCYGARLLPQVLDELAKSDPARIYATLPLSSDLAQGFRHVTVLEMAQATNAFAWWLDERIGKSSSFETVAYMGVPDLRYVVVFLGAVKCGYKLLLPSMRNATWMNQSLLDQTGCSKFYCSPEMLPKARELQTQKKDLDIDEIPSLDDLIHGPSKHYPYQEVFENVKRVPVLVLHSSGSTGPPKPVVWTHGSFAVIDNDRKLPKVNGRRNQSFDLWNFPEGGGRYFSNFPPFHFGGVCGSIVLPIFSTTATLVLGPTDKPSTGHMVSQIMHHIPLRALFCPPSILEQLVQEPEGIDQCTKLDWILYAGGPLTPNTGSALSKVTDLMQFYGSTETGATPALLPSQEDWAYLEWHPSYAADMQASEDDAYEMVLHKDPSLDGVRAIFNNFPTLDEWHTKDLFRPHPTKPGLWKFHGRLDDVIVLSNGLKFNPVQSEGMITGHPLLTGALIVGQGKFQAALLVESKESEMEKTALVEAIWPLVEQANQEAPGQARITKSMIAVSDPSKPFERAAKGTIVRKMTAEKYAAEIEALYTEQDSSKGLKGPELSRIDDLPLIQDFVRICIGQSFSLHGVESHSDLYVLGLDSLKTLEITAMLKAGIQRHSSDASWLTSQAVYAHPTIAKLSQFIFEHANPNTASVSTTNASRESEITALLRKYTSDLPQRQVPESEHPRTSNLNVVLTGSTGSFGTYLLRSLLDDPIVSKITCLNRSNDAQNRQQKIFSSLGLKHDLSDSRVNFFQAEYGQPGLGLATDLYKELVTTTDILIHNAWKVDFNHSLTSFEPVHIRGVRNLIDWSIHSARNPRLIFISSISSIGAWNSVHGTTELVPEAPVESGDVAEPMGYAESKNAAEQILGFASQHAGLRTSILRVGQIAGPVDEGSRGVWNEDEWVPSMIKTSKALGALPGSLPSVDWIPVDRLARATIDVMHAAGGNPAAAAVYNVVHPRPVPWIALLENVRTCLGDGVRIVPLAEWIAMVAKVDVSDVEEVTAMPAAKILGFFEDLRKQGEGVKYRTENAVEASRTLANLEPVGKDWMGLWLRGWGY